MKNKKKDEKKIYIFFFIVKNLITINNLNNSLNLRERERESYTAKIVNNMVVLYGYISQF